MQTLPPPPSTPELIQQLAAIQGLALTSEQAEALVPALEMILRADAQLAALELDDLPAVGLPWEIGLEGYEQYE